MKIKSITALLAASFLLTACGNLSETSGTDMVGETISSINSTSTSSITNITANENFVSKTEIKTSENEYFPTTYECIPQCAPSMSITFAIPDGWSYETVQTNDDPTSSISVCLKPDAEADGSIIFEYTKDGIEVSDSALSEIETEFNGYPATEGTYLCSEQWDHIFLKGDYEGCAVLNNANDWYDKYADEIEYILSTVEFRKYD